MRSLPPLALALVLASGVASAMPHDTEAPPRFEMSSLRLEPHSALLADSRFRLRGEVRHQVGRGSFEMPGLRLESQWRNSGAGCVPDLIFANGFQ